MSAADELRDLLAGRAPAGGLLQTLRLEAAGAEFYGEEAVLERGRAAPLDLSDPTEVRGVSQLALFAGDVAAIADVYDERIGRAWVLSPGESAEPEPAVAVAFDTDLHQQRGAVMWDAADHPNAAPALLDRLAAVGESLLDRITRDGSAYRVRAFLVRAFGSAERGVGLFALHRLGPGPERASGWSYAAVLVDPAGDKVVRDLAGEAATVPALHRL